MAVVLILSATLFAKVGNFLKFGSISIQQEQAISLAEAGVDNTVRLLNENGGSCPTACTVETTLGTVGSFKVTVVDNSPNLKTITSTGYIPNSTSPKEKRTVKAQVGIDSTSIAFHYAAQTGNGGAIMDESATIEGNIYSNGSITVDNDNQQTITGDAYAVGTIAPGIFVQGTKHPGASPAPFPVVDYNYWKTQANINNDPITCSPTCEIKDNTPIFGPKKYIGNLLISNNAIVTMTGPVWVTGNFTMTQGGTTLQLDNSFGSFSTALIIDGVASLNQGGQFSPTNASPPGYIMLVTTSTADPAINLSQQGATAIFYALNGAATLSQKANVTALVANKLTMTNRAILQYSTGLGSSQFSTGPGASWVIKKGTYKQTSSP